ncbi:hypothetical protein [Geodermatophilus sp. SYSU D01176]
MTSRRDRRSRRLPGRSAYGEVAATWSSNWPHGEPGDDLHRLLEPPENEVPVTLPQNVLLARTEGVAVALLDLQVYSTGAAFQLAVRVRPSARASLGHRLDELMWDRGRGSAHFLLGIELADGRRGSNVPGRSTEGVLFHSRGGSGGDSSLTQRWWLSPLPPEGPLRLVVRCAESGIAEAAVELDASAMRAAAEHVVELWPWEPEPPHREPPRPPDLSGDSWFARR